MGNAAAFRSGPEVAVGSAYHRVEAIATDSLCVAFVIGREVDPVEANQAIKRRKPEIPIRRLTDRPHCVYGQTVVGGPSVDGYLRRGLGGEANREDRNL